MNEPIKSSGGFKEHPRHRDDPRGLGWKLWRRLNATGLLQARIHRALGRLNGHSFIGRNSLMADIHRRWGMNQYGEFHGYKLSFPLAIGRRLPFHPDGHSHGVSAPSYRPEALPLEAMTGSQNRPLVAPKISKTTQGSATYDGIQSKGVRDHGHSVKGLTSGEGSQPPEKPAGFRTYDSSGIAERTVTFKATAPVSGLQQAEQEHTAGATSTGNHFQQAMGASDFVATAGSNRKRSEGSFWPAEEPKQAPAGQIPNKNAPAIKPELLMRRYGPEIVPATLKQSDPLSTGFQLPGKHRHGKAILAGSSCSGLPSSNLDRHSELLGSPWGKSTSISSGAGQAEGMASRSTDRGVPDPTRFDSLAIVSGTTGISRPGITGGRFVGIHGRGVTLPLILRSAPIEAVPAFRAGGRIVHGGKSQLSLVLIPTVQRGSGFSPRRPASYREAIQRCARAIAAPVSKSSIRLSLKGQPLNLAAATHRRAMHIETSSFRSQISHHETEQIVQPLRSQGAALSGLEKAAAEGKERSPSRRLESKPLDSIQTSDLSTKEIWHHISDHRKPAPIMFGLPALIPMSSVGGMNRLQHRVVRSHGISPDGYPFFRAIRKAPSMGSIPDRGSIGPPTRRSQIGWKDAPEDAVTMPDRPKAPLAIEVKTGTRFTLFRQKDRFAKGFLQSDTPSGAVREMFDGKPRFPRGGVSLAPSIASRLAHIHSDTFQAMEAPGPPGIKKAPGFLPERITHAPYAMMGSAFPVFRSIQRQSAGRTKAIGDEISLKAFRKYGDAAPDVSLSGTAFTEIKSGTGGHHLNFSLNPPIIRSRELRFGHHWLRHPAGRPAIMQTAAKRETQHAVGIGRQSHKAGAWRSILFRQTVYPRVTLGRAAGENTYSDRAAGSGTIVQAGSLNLPLVTNMAGPVSKPPMDTGPPQPGPLQQQVIYAGAILPSKAANHNLSVGRKSAGTTTDIRPFQSDRWPFLLLNRPARHPQEPSDTMMGKSSHEMPLHLQPVSDVRGQINGDYRVQRSSVSHLGRRSTDRNFTATVGVPELPVIAETPPGSGKETADAGARSDMDELVEKIWHKIMHKLTIEQERRGRSPWI